MDKSDLINVTTANGLTISSGTLNLTNAGSMTTGNYMLIDYSGSLNGNVNSIALGTKPAGFSYSLVNNVSNKSIDLLVTSNGDFNGDGTVDAADYVLWRKGLGAKFTPADYDAWRSHLGQTTSSGDFNGDGTVDAADYVLWRKGLGTKFAPTDYGTWRAHFGQSAGSGTGVSANAAVPEPVTLVLLMFAPAGSCFRRRRAT